ncbi:MAG: hypothetical protein A2289_12905 [Deltaproteobacteria bacterium RIFOXYA12_FULL_58_15]|nr:MAG: hypothetical protein A2289_12905 [Deltaproteobacteria bacterium RIFOXYA12_FULL_58_15]OGR13938.1 MAG: hypothetical protein A2341_04435 [Deltaproteobacteria bacterium RIFOXYB12_FULL_58_9]
MKMKLKSLDDILANEYEDGAFRIAFERKRFYLQIAHLVRDIRSTAGMSQVEVARRAGVSQSMVARLETGDHRRTPTLDTVYKILRALGYTFSIDVSPVKKVA